MNSRLLSATVVASAAICAAGLQAQGATQKIALDSGIVYETISKTTMPFGTSTERTRTIETPRGTRVEILERTRPFGLPTSENPFVGNPGSYTLTIYDRSATYQVDTVKREYFELGVTELLDESSDISKMIANMKMTVSRSKFEAEDLGDGGLLIGHPTSHWKVYTGMTTSMVAGEDTLVTVTEISADNFYSKNIVHPTPRLSQARDVRGNPDSSMRAIVRGLIGEDSARARQTYSRLPKTLKLKSIEKTTTQVATMDMALTTTREVTSVKSDRFDEALFQIPKDYKNVKVPLPSLTDLQSRR